jgi:MFS family permease
VFPAAVPEAARVNFRWFVAGRLVSLLGSSMAPVALAFAVLDASRHAGDLGIVLAARMVPNLVFLLVGGAVADRFSRRTVLVLANLGAASTQGAVAAILLTHHYSLAAVAVLEFANGVLDAFTMPALRGVVPELVDKSRLRQANSLLSSTRNATRILGPSVSGLLVVTAGSGWAIAFDALTFLLAAGCLARLRLAATVPHQSSTVLADIRDGWTIFRGIRWVWIVSGTFCVLNMIQTGTWQILGPELTRRVSGAATWGFVLSARGVGLLLMSVVMYRLAVRHFLRLGQVSVTLVALPLLALGLHRGAPWLVVSGFVAGLGSSIAGIAWDTSIQEHVPPHALSRVASYDDLLSYVAIPIGQLAVGPLADAIGGFRLVSITGWVYIVLALAPLISREVRDLPHARRPAPPPAPRDGPARRRGPRRRQGTAV